MLNRQQRRALERAEKKTHKLEPQVCVLWVPVARGYLEHFTLGGFSVVGESERAQRFCEHYASMVAAMMREGDKLASFRSLAAVLARIDAYATGAVEPRELFFAPIRAVGNLLAKEGTTIGDYDLVEANEAFASQALADGDALGWDWDRVNVHGGAIALGHPIGASGARVLVTLLHALADRGVRRGLATLCLGGGDAVALSVTRP